MWNIRSLVICVQLFQKIYVSGWNSRGAWKGTISNRFEPSGHAAAGIFKLQLVPFVSLIRLSENQCGSVNLQVCQRICKKYTRQLAAKLCRVSSRKFARSVQLWISHSRKTKYCCGGQHVTVIKLPHRLGLVRRWHSLCTSWRISSVPSMLASVRRPDLEWSTDLWQRFFAYERAIEFFISPTRLEFSHISLWSSRTANLLGRYSLYCVGIMTVLCRCTGTPRNWILHNADLTGT